jgi:hypothetical protein
MSASQANPEPSSQALPAGTRIEEFVIERVLGSGGFGITYLARDTALGRQVVIKENLPVQFCFRDTHSLTVAPRHSHGEDAENFQWSLENFSKEAAMLASLDHPGIVKVLRSFEAFGTAYFVMPFVEGVTLDELLVSRRAKGREFSEDELRGILERALSALAHLHDRGIYHRDIKPGNILITNDGIPVLIDFGSARQRLSERSMTVVESAGYTPFEQLQSRGNVGPWSDLYALAATFVKVMTCEAPPKSNDRTMGDPWQPLSGRSDLTGSFSSSFLRGLDVALKLPIEERLQSAEQWIGALEGGKIPVLKRQKEERPAAEAAKKLSIKWPLAAAALLTLSIGGVGGWLALRGGPETLPSIFAPAPGGLVIASEPSGAKVFNEAGEKLGSTPAELKGLPGGQPWIGRLELEDYQLIPVMAEVVSGATKLLPVVKLTPIPQKVIVTSDPGEAEVLEGGLSIGRTPWEGGLREVESAVEFTLRKAGYDELPLRGEVALGEPLMLQGKLKASAQKVTVTSEPTGAEVLEDGKSLGKTPFESTDVSPGTAVSYQLRLEGYEESEVSGEILIGESLVLSGNLNPSLQKILISSEPSGADVLEDKSVIGKTPHEVPGIVPGTEANFLLRLTNHKEKFVSGKVMIGQTLNLHAALMPSVDFTLLRDEAVKDAVGKPRDRHSMPVYLFPNLIRIVRTVGYSANGKNEVGEFRRYDNTVRSAAADWSFYPVGTSFRINGLPYLYVVDDWVGEAVGCGSIYIFNPNPEIAEKWGTRNIKLTIVQWGSFTRGAELLSDSFKKNENARHMLDNIIRQRPDLAKYGK